MKSLLDNWGRPFFDLSDGAPSVAGDPAAQNWHAAYLRYAESPHAAELITRLNCEIDIVKSFPPFRYRPLSCTVRAIVGTPIDEGRYSAARIPHAEFHLLPGDDHIPQYGDQDRLIGEIEEFLDWHTNDRKGRTDADDRADDRHCRFNQSTQCHGG